MVRTVLNSPFVPGSDRIPEIWAGRVDELADWRHKLRPRRVAGIYERGRVLLGPPGIGKSVLANRIAADASERGDHVAASVRVATGTDPLVLVSEAVSALADSLQVGRRVGTHLAELVDRVRRVGGVELEPVPSGRGTHRDLYRLLVELGRIAGGDGVTVVIRIDEIQNLTEPGPLSQLLVAIGDALAHEDEVVDPAGNPHRRVLPIAVYLTGLPEFVDATARAGATFARRFATFHLGPLSDTEIRKALVPFTTDGFPVPTPQGPSRVFMDDGAIARIVGRCLGDPYLFQLAGDAAWNAGTAATITAGDVDRGWRLVAPEASRHVQRTLDRLPERERAVVDALCALEPGERTASAVAARLGHDGPQRIGSALQRLDDLRGVIARGRPITFRMRTVEALVGGVWP